MRKSCFFDTMRSPTQNLRLTHQNHERCGDEKYLDIKIILNYREKSLLHHVLLTNGRWFSCI